MMPPLLPLVLSISGVQFTALCKLNHAEQYLKGREAWIGEEGAAFHRAFI